MTIAISLRTIFNRMVVLLLSFGFYALEGMAQNTLPERLNYVLETKDIEMGLKLYNEITEADLRQLPDSVLFYYHYLGASINCLDLIEVPQMTNINNFVPNHQNALCHFNEAKRICETSIGVHYIGYLEIMYGYGNLYMELKQYDQALGIFQEGIVKSLAIRSSWPKDFANLIMGVQECYERLGWYSEIPNHLYDAWSFWPKDETPLVTYTYFPLWRLEQFYRRYEMYDKALQVSDEIIYFITQNGGEQNPELAEALYMRGNTLVDMGQVDEGIGVFQNGLDILESNKLEYNDNYSYYLILDNLLFALISAERWDDSQVVLNKIKNYGTNCGDEELYNSSLTAVAFVLCKNRFYDKALIINTELLERQLSDDRKQTAESQQEEIIYSKNVISSIPEMERILPSMKIGSNEWFEMAYKLASAYSRINNSEKLSMILDRMYQTIPSNTTAKDEYYYAILSSLFHVYFDKGNFDLALKYANESFDYISLIPDIPDRVIFDCLNNLVVAKSKSNKLDGVYDDLEKATELCRTVFGEESEPYAIQLHNKGRVLQLSGRFDEAIEEYLRSIALYTKVKGAPMPKTVRYLMETEEQLVDYELDL